MVGIPDPERRLQGLPARAVGRHGPAGDDRHGARLRAGAAHRRRADDRPRRDDPGPDPGPDAPPAARRPGRPSSSSPTTWAWSPRCATGSRSCTPARSWSRPTSARCSRDPKHPYTRGLIGSVPVLGVIRDELAVIPGNVPNLIDLPPAAASRRAARRASRRGRRRLHDGAPRAAAARRRPRRPLLPLPRRRTGRRSAAGRAGRMTAGRAPAAPRRPADRPRRAPRRGPRPRQALPDQGRHPAAHGRRGAGGRRRRPRRSGAARRSASSASPAAARRPSGGCSCASSSPTRGHDRLRRHGHHRGSRARRSSRTGAGCRSSSRTRTPRSTRARRSATASARACGSTASATPASGAPGSQRIMDMVGLAAVPRPALPARVLRRPAPAHRHRPGPRPGARPRRLRRAGLRPRRLHPGAGPEPAQGPPARARPDLPLHRPQHGRRRAHQRPGRGDVPGPRRRDHRPRADLRRAAPPVHAGAAVGHPGPEPGAAADAGHPRRRRALPGQPAGAAAASTPAARCGPSWANPELLRDRGPGARGRTATTTLVACHFRRRGRAAAGRDVAARLRSAAPAGACGPAAAARRASDRRAGRAGRRADRSPA